MATLDSKASALAQRKTKLVQELETLAIDKEKAKQQLQSKKDDAKKAKKNAEDFDRDLARLAGGHPMWEEIADQYGLSCPPVPLAVGATNDKFGHDKPEEPEEEAEKAKTDKPKEDEKLEKLGPDGKPIQTDEEQRAADRKKKEQLVLEMAEIEGLPTAKEREDRLVALEASSKLKRDELSKIHQQAVDDVQKSLEGMPPGKIDEDPKAVAAELGVPVAAIKAYQARARLEALRTMAAASLGMDDGQAALDQLWALGKDRGMKPGELLDHLAHTDPALLPPHLREAAARSRKAATARIEAIEDPGARQKALDAHTKQCQTADQAEKDQTETQELAESMDCDPKLAKSHVDQLMATTGCSRQKAIAALKNKGTAAEPMDPARLKEQLELLHTYPEPKRSEELAKLATEVDGKQLIGATMRPQQADPDGILTGPVGNEALKAQFAAIRGLPKDQQWAAYQALGGQTGFDPKELYLANKNFERQQRARSQVNDWEADPKLTEPQRIEKMRELAERLHTTVDKLRASVKRQRLETAKRLDLARKNDPGLDKRIRTLESEIRNGKVKPADLAARWGEISKECGIPVAHLVQRSKMNTFNRKKKEWAKAYEKSPREAADFVARMCQEHDVEPDRLAILLRFGDPSKMSKEELEARAQLLKRDQEAYANSDEAKARKKAGLGKNDQVRKMEPGSADYDAMMRKAGPIYDQLNDTCEDETKIVKTLEKLSDAEIAALFRNDPDLYDRIKKVLAGEDKKLLARWSAVKKQAKAYNKVVDEFPDGDGTWRKANDEQAEWAAKTQADTAAAREAAEVLELPIGEARSHLKSLALHNKQSLQEAVSALKNTRPTP